MKILESKQYKEYWYVVLATPIGHRNGYVALLSDNILLYSKWNDLEQDINCHGGITYFGDGQWQGANINELLENNPENKQVFWLGFDTAHSMDAPDPTLMTNPYLSMGFRNEGIMRTTEYVAKECEDIIDQLVLWYKRIPSTERLRTYARRKTGDISYLTLKETMQNLNDDLLAKKGASDD